MLKPILLIYEGNFFFHAFFLGGGDGDGGVGRGRGRGRGVLQRFSSSRSN